MISQEEKEKIDEEIAQFPQRSAACIEALKVIQENRGHVSDDAIKDVADYLRMSPEQVDGIATFYSLIFRKPVGRNVILVCDSISCYVMGYQQIAEYLKKKLGIDWGQTTEDKKFTLLPIPCLGDCDHAPVMMVNEDQHRDLTEEKIDEILNQYE